MLRPVIGEARHRAHPGQLDGGLLVTDLRGRRGERLVIQPGVLKLGIGPVQSSDRLGGLVAPVGDDQGNQRGRSGDSVEDQLHNPYTVMRRDGLRGAAAAQLRFAWARRSGPGGALYTLDLVPQCDQPGTARSSQVRRSRHASRKAGRCVVVRYVAW